MPETIPAAPSAARRHAAVLDGDFVVFLIGMRINTLHRPDLWMPVARSMPQMLAELARQPSLGLLGARTLWMGRHIEVVQYWRSFEHLHAYAHARDAAHLPAWRAFNRAAAASGAVGIWHETYRVAADAYEAVYVNLPPHGQGQAGRLVDATGSRATARGRLGAAAGSAAAAPVSA